MCCEWSVYLHNPTELVLPTVSRAILRDLVVVAMWTTQRTMYAKWYGMAVETIKRRTPVVITRCFVELTANAVGDRLKSISIQKGELH